MHSVTDTTKVLLSLYVTVISSDRFELCMLFFSWCMIHLVSFKKKKKGSDF